uniref:Uncharacterized protein n=1 Tax=Strigamia maritima TaxID=126957 RepID=T1JFC2_STRMM
VVGACWSRSAPIGNFIRFSELLIQRIEETGHSTLTSRRSTTLNSIIFAAARTRNLQTGQLMFENVTKE